MEMKARCWIWFWLAPLAGAQPLSALVEEALHNNREILAAQKKVEALRQRPARESKTRRRTKERCGQEHVPYCWLPRPRAV